jgi:hypothetical protein
MSPETSNIPCVKFAYLENIETLLKINLIKYTGIKELSRLISINARRIPIVPTADAS